MKILYTTEEGGLFEPMEIGWSSVTWTVFALIAGRPLNGIKPHAVLFPNDRIWDVKNGFRKTVEPGRFKEVLDICEQRARS